MLHLLPAVPLAVYSRVYHAVRLMLLARAPHFADCRGAMVRNGLRYLWRGSI